MKKFLLRILIIAISIPAVIACSRISTNITDPPEDQEESDTIGRGPLSSIDEYLNFSYTGEQWVGMDEVRLRIDGLVDSSVVMDYPGVLSLSSQFRVVTLDCIDGWSVKMRWEGVLVEDLIREAGIKDSAMLAIFHSYDGYQIQIMLKDVIASKMMLAYKVNGDRLPLKLGFPFQLVAEGMPGFNWVKGVEEIEIK